MSDYTKIASQIICILGMHRSGTSLIAGLLNLLGVYLGPEEHIMRPAEDNPKGFWEHDLLTALNDEILARLGGSWHEPPIFPSGWESSPQLADLRQRARAILQEDFGTAELWGWKDPRTCLTLPFWQKLLPSLQYVICLRNPVDVARSLERRDDFSFEKGIGLWLNYVKSMLEHTSRQPRFFIFYEDVMDNWQRQVKRLVQFLGKPELTERAGVQKAIEEFIDEELQHSHTSMVQVVEEAKLAFPVKALYMALRVYVSHQREQFGKQSDVDQALQQAVDSLSSYALEAQKETNELRNRLAEVKKQLMELEQVVQELERARDQLREHVFSLQEELRNYRESLLLRILLPYRKMIDKLLPMKTRRRLLYTYAINSVKILVDEGWKSLFARISGKIRANFHKKAPPDAGRAGMVDPNALPPCSPEQYRLWMSIHRPSHRALKQMQREAKRFAYRPTISVCMPVYNTEERWLTKALNSVCAQVYDDWELIAIDDGSDQPHVKRLLTSYAKQDKRIQAQFKDKNEGIPKTLNQAFAHAQGDFIVIVDSDDILEPHALYELVRYLNEHGPDWDLIYSDEALINEEDYVFYIHFRPDFSPDFLLSHQYFVHLVAVRRSLLQEIGGCDETFPNVAWDYDLWLRATAQARKIGHISKVLYLWRRCESLGSHHLKDMVMEQSKRALEKAMKLKGIEGTVENGLGFNYFRVRRRLKKDEKLTIIIPTKNRVELLDRCIKSIEANTSFDHYEIVVVANNPDTDVAKTYLQELTRSHRVLYYNKPYNFSALNNYAARMTQGEHLLFLNDDMEVLAEGSIEAMLEHSQREEVGAVGARLLFPNDTVQHAGVVIGLLDACEHIHKFHPANDLGYLGSLIAIRNYSAVTAACMMVPRRVFERVGGFDERLAVVFNDIDLCLRIRQLGYLIVYTPYAEFRHYEHATRKANLPLHPQDEDLLFKERWREMIQQGDPYYNPNLSRRHFDCRPRFDDVHK